jgi:hypothetical protein
MVSLGALWLPVLLSAVLVFVTSSIIHMVLRYHSSDYTRLPNEDVVREAIRSGKPAPKQYIIPYAMGPKDLESPEMKRKFEEGPVGVLNIRPSGAPGMGKNLVQWFVFALVVSFFVAYVACHALPSGTEYLRVFQLVGAVAFLAYAAGQLPAAIWMGKPWAIAWKEVFDGLLYGLVTAGSFGWLWPR